MRNWKFVLLVSGLLSSINSNSQTITLDKSKVEPVGVFMSIEKLGDKKVVRVVKDSSITAADEPTYARVKGVELKNGTIEVKVLSRLLPNAAETARGFIGIAFRISDDNSKFESIYIRPTNGRADNQIRRNHSIQYFSYPDYKFDRLRKEAPEQYESYADMGLNEWITLKVVIKDQQAKLYINGSKQPVLIVNDLKHGADMSGGIGLWVDGGTEGFFSDLRISK